MIQRTIQFFKAFCGSLNLVFGMVLRIWPVLVLQLAMWAMLSYFDQLQDLVHETKRSSVRNIFMYLAVVLMTLWQSSVIQVLIRSRSHLRTRIKTPPRYLLFFWHFTPTLLGIVCGLLPLLPYYGLPVDASSMAQDWLQHTPFLSDLLVTDPSFLATGQVIDRLGLVLFIPAVLFTRFYDPGNGRSWHLHMMFYALPSAGLGFLYLVIFEDLPFWPFIGLSTLYVLTLDLWFAWKRESVTSSSRNAFLVPAGFVVIGSLLFLYSPAYWSNLFGPLPTVLCFICLLLLLVIIIKRAPASIQLSVIVVVVLLVASGNYGSRPVRLLPYTAQLTHSGKEHARQWLLQPERLKEIKESEKAPYPVFFVTADGGGIRAAYWTSAILGALADDYPNFLQHVFLLSGASGGSVGEAVFAGLTTTAREKDFEQVAREILDKDFLAAPLGLLLWRDLWTSVFYFGDLRTTYPPQVDDRATMLELVLENSFELVTGSGVMREPFSALWDGDRRFHVPSLILNATKRGDGQHRIVSNLRLAPKSIDLLHGLPRDNDLALSTAAFLSARFPLISPNGATPVNQDKDITEDIIDGGYFDNSGAAGALLALKQFLAATREITPPLNIQPIAIVITNDTNRTDLPKLDPTEQCEFQLDEPSAPVANLITTPLGTLDGIRQQVTEARRIEFMNAIVEASGKVLKLGLFRCKGDLKFPLGWTLSGKSRNQIDDKIKRTTKASSDFARIGELLSRMP